MLVSAGASPLYFLWRNPAIQMSHTIIIFFIGIIISFNIIVTIFVITVIITLLVILYTFPGALLILRWVTSSPSTAIQFSPWSKSPLTSPPLSPSSSYRLFPFVVSQEESRHRDDSQPHPMLVTQQYCDDFLWPTLIFLWNGVVRRRMPFSGLRKCGSAKIVTECDSVTTNVFATPINTNLAIWALCQMSRFRSFKILVL